MSRAESYYFGYIVLNLLKEGKGHAYCQWASQFEGLSVESSHRLQKVGGMILDMVK